MFNLIRRISHSVIPRPDRPWADDATSNAPRKGRKRRMSSTELERDANSEESNKKIRGESVMSSIPDGVQQAETQEVKDVTQGVKKVELVDTQKVIPEAIPLPEEESDELDEPGTPLSKAQDSKEDSETDDIASSVNGDLDDSTATSLTGQDVESEKGEKEETGGVVGGGTAASKFIETGLNSEETKFLDTTEDAPPNKD